MSKYLDGNNEIDMQKLEEKYREFTEKAVATAKEDTDAFLEEIKYYREHTFEEIEKDVRALYNSEEYRKSVYEDYAHERACEIVGEESLDFERIKRTENEILLTLSDIEKQNIIESKIQEILAYKRKNDILYDLITEEQLQKYLELYYTSRLKSELVYARTNAIDSTATSLGKQVDGLMYHEAYNVVNVEYQSDEDKVKKQRIKDGLASIPRALGFSTTAGVVGTLLHNGLLSLITGYSYSEILEEYGILTASVLFAAMLTIVGVMNIKDFFESKKAIQRAKDLGIYDLLLEKFKAEENFEAYDNELRDMYADSSEVEEEERRSVL